MMKTKRLYQSPWTRRDVVELEDGFCGSTSIMESPANIEAAGHETGFDSEDGGNTFTGGGKDGGIIWE